MSREIFTPISIAAIRNTQAMQANIDTNTVMRSRKI